jgi:hypothetical protein
VLHACWMIILKPLLAAGAAWCGCCCAGHGTGKRRRPLHSSSTRRYADAADTCVMMPAAKARNVRQAAPPRSNKPQQRAALLLR